MSNNSKKNIINRKDPPELIRRMQGHLGSINSISIFDKGGKIISGGEDGTVRLWDLKKGECLKTLEGHRGKVLSVTVISDKNQALSSGADGTVRLWDLEKGKCLKTLEGHRGWVSSVTVISDKNQALSSGEDGMVRLWDLENGTCLKTLEGHREWVWSVTVISDRNQALSSGEDGTVRLWDLEKGKCLKSLKGHGGWVWSVTVISERNQALSSGADGTVRLWDLEKGKCLKTLEGHRGMVLSVTVISDKNQALSSDSDGTLRLWDLEKGKCLKTLEAHCGWVRSVTILPDKNQALSSGEDGFIIIWNISIKKEKIEHVEKFITYNSAKVVLIGDSMVGKSCVARALMGMKFEDQETTHGMKFWRLDPRKIDPDIQIPEDEEREIVLWDMGGQDEYRLIHQLFLHDTTLALLLMDPTRGRTSLEKAEEWDRELKKQFKERETLKLLVGTKVDSDHLKEMIDKDAIKDFCRKYEFKDYVETSAKRNRGIEKLRSVIGKNIDWKNLCHRSRPEIFQIIQGEIQKRQDNNEAFLYYSDLKDFHKDEGAIDHVVTQMAAQGIIADTRLASGERALVLRVDKVEEYAGSLIRSARRNPRRVPVIEERILASPDIPLPGMKKEQRLPRFQELIVLECVIEILIKSGLCLRHEKLLIFPSLMLSDDEGEEQKFPESSILFYDFSGAIDNVYASLVTRLVLSEKFDDFRLGSNYANFTSKAEKGFCGVRRIKHPRGFAHLDLFFGKDTPKKQKKFFQAFVQDHLESHGIDVFLRFNLKCECGKKIEEGDIFERINLGYKDVLCPICEKRTIIPDAISKPRNSDIQAVWAMQGEIDERIREQSEEVRKVFKEHDEKKIKELPIRILHLSDLHFTEDTKVDSRFTFLSDDLKKDLKIDSLDFLVITGDFSHKCNPKGFEKAEEFISCLIDEFGLSGHRCIFAPGNHDLEWIEDLYSAMPVTDGNPHLSLKEGLFPKRFSKFSESVWRHFMTSPYPLDFDKQGMAFYSPDTPILFITLNSAWKIDQFHTKASEIHTEAMANAIEDADDKIKDAFKGKDPKILKICLFHHSIGRIQTIPKLDFIGHLFKNGFQVCLHGDVHDIQRDIMDYWRKSPLHIIGAGSFGSQPEGRPESIPLSYNLLEVERNFKKIRVHTRCQKTGESAWEGWNIWSGKGKSKAKYPYYDITFSI